MMGGDDQFDLPFGEDPMGMSLRQPEKIIIRDHVDKPKLTDDIVKVVREEIRKLSCEMMVDGVVGEESEPEETKYEFSSVLAILPREDQLELASFAMKYLAHEDLHSKGFETEYHITVCYGIHGDDSDQVEHVLREQGPVAASLARLEVFSTPEFDVLHVAVESASFADMHTRLIESIPNTQSHGEYNPHVTLAYLKPGLGAKYLKAMGDFHYKSVAFDTLEFSSRNGDRVHMLLDGPVRFSSSPQAQEYAEKYPVMMAILANCARKTN